MSGTPAVPFSDLFRDTVLAHGVAWAWSYYSRRGMPQWEFRHWCRVTLC